MRSLCHVLRLLPEIVAEIFNPSGEVLLRGWGFRMTHRASEEFMINFLSSGLGDFKRRGRNTRQSPEPADQLLNWRT